MSTIGEAVQAAEDRKSAALGEADEPTVTDPNKFQRRAVFSGFDIDDDELTEIASRAGRYMAKLVADTDMPLRKGFATCWTDAFLIGLMMGRSHGTDSP